MIQALLLKFLEIIARLGSPLLYNPRSFTRTRSIMRLEPAERIWVGDEVSTVNPRWSSRHATIEHSVLLVLSKSSWRVVVLVDDTGHTVLAMVSNGLSAVEPDWILVGDGDLEDLVALALSNGDKAGEEGFAVRLGVAGVEEVGLDDGVVPWEEVELDDFTDLGDNVVWVEVEASAADDDGVSDAVVLGWSPVVAARDFSGAGWSGGGASDEDGSQSGGDDSDGLGSEHFDC
ncbi:hypothetical protein ABW19_dt0208574 [Dactylella cylindrospora]|nr:hypothetical protein ABW19_dt0208574 [Dactylella cylindrospora]